MSQAEIDELHIYEAIREDIEKRFVFRTQFFGHLVSFLIFTILIWHFWIGPGSPDSQTLRRHWLATFTTGAWAMGVFIHFINWMFFEMRENAIQREMRRYRLSQIKTEKTKRKFIQGERLVRLTEDGELEEVNGEDMPAEKRRSRAKRLP